MAFDAVSLEGVSKVYGRHRALGGVSLRLEPGRLTALVGPNGAGKSTLIGILSTLVRPSAGRVRYETSKDGAGGAPDAAAIRTAIGVLAHDSFVYGELDAVENLSFWASLYAVDDAPRRVAALLDEVGLDAAARRRPAKTFSRGMTQRLALARALLARPRLLLLDEPFTGLDRGGIEALRRTLEASRAERRITLVVTHDFEAIADLCDHLVVLRAGKLVLDERTERPYALGELKERYLLHMG